MKKTTKTITIFITKISLAYTRQQYSANETMENQG